MREIVFLLLATSLIAVPREALAQDAAGSSAGFSRLQERLRIGDRLTVRLDDGTTVDGRFDDMSNTQLAVTADGARRLIPADRVTRIQRRRNGVLLGTIIGAVAGVPFGLALRSYVHNEGGSEPGALLFPIGIGAGAGLAIDALLATNRTVYVR